MGKYYTPASDEFFIGFEYEINDMAMRPRKEGNNRDLWLAVIFGDEFISFIGRQESLNLWARVKYLDRNDVGNLGWAYKEFNPQGDGDFRWYDAFDLKGGYYRLNAWYHDESMGDNLCDLVTITTSAFERDIIFRGKIKNKSELQRIMKMIGI